MNSGNNQHNGEWMTLPLVADTSSFGPRQAPRVTPLHCPFAPQAGIWHMPAERTRHFHNRFGHQVYRDYAAEREHHGHRRGGADYVRE